MTPLTAFSADYIRGRQRFRDLVHTRKWQAEELALPVKGYAFGELTIDTARIGPADATRLLILSSGLHGVEAPLGAAVQVEWLNSLPTSWEPPKGSAILLIHTLNPFGWHRWRRWDEAGVDLNRNFLAPLEFGTLKEKTSNNLYRKLDQYLNPTTPLRGINWFRMQATWCVLRYGKAAINATLPVGQYAFPKGIFYGGDRPSETTRIVMEQAPKWIGNAEEVIHLDFHTGLGDWGKYQLLLDQPIGSPLEVMGRSRFPGRVAAVTEQVYQNHGGFGPWLMNRFADRRYLFLTAEFGTYSGMDMIVALQRENRAFWWDDPESAEYHAAKEQIKEMFVPKSSGWRWSVVRQGVELIDHALGGWV